MSINTRSEFSHLPFMLHQVANLLTYPQFIHSAASAALLDLRSKSSLSFPFSSISEQQNDWLERTLVSTSPLFLLWTFPFNISMNCEFLRSYFLVWSYNPLIWAFPISTLSYIYSMLFIHEVLLSYEIIKVVYLHGQRNNKAKDLAKKEDLFPM